VWWKILIMLVAFALVLTGGGVYFLEKSGLARTLQEQLNPKLKPLEVKFGVVEKGDVVRTVNAPGEVEPERVVEISAQVSAKIIELPIEVGDVVKKGDLLVKLDSRDLAALLDAAKAQLRAEEARREGVVAELANAEAELSRRQRLIDNKDIAVTELEGARLAYDRAVSSLRQVEQNIESARANIRRAEKDLDNTVITAAIDGVITKRNAEIGETVVVGTLNNPGSVILELADLDTMQVKARVDEANIALLKRGQKATLFVNAYPDLKLTGEVDLIGLKRVTGTDGSRYFETEVKIQRPRELLLRSGLTANVDIEVESHRGVLKVPTQAVLDRSVDDLPTDVVKDNPNIDKDKKFTRVVYIDRDGKAWPVPVRTAASDQTHTIVTAGIEEGTKLVVGPFKALTKLEKDQKLAEEGTITKHGRQARKD
jgi:HlyD family secretion protein